MSCMGHDLHRFRDIVKQVKERSSGLNNDDFFIDTALNPHHWLLRLWDVFIRIVSMYHFIMVPINIRYVTALACCRDVFFMYIHICIYIYMYVYINIYIYVCIFIYTCIQHLCMNICTVWYLAAGLFCSQILRI